MKKIRFLAALLVILMLPLGVLVGCNKDPKDPVEDDPTEDPGTDTPNKPSGGDISNTPADNDGLSGNGYLVMFNFNVAKRGDLPTVAPYSRYLKTTDKLSGTIYIVDDKAGKDGSGALLIQRTKSNAKSSVAFMATALGATFGTQHTLEFDVKLGKGLFGDTLNVIADNGEGRALISVTPDGKITDCDGTALYESECASEWVHVAICVDSRARTYDAYINGVKKLDELSFSSSENAPDITQYLFTLAGKTYDNTYCYLDNMAFIDGLTPKEHTSSDITYKDHYKATYDVFTASKIDESGRILPNAEALANIYGTTYRTQPNTNPYAYNSAIAMSNLLTIVKMEKDSGKVVEDVYTDYGVFTGLYNYGEPVGGKLYVSGSGDDAKSIDFDATKGLTFTAKNIGGETGEISGTYYVYGSEDAPKVALIYGENLEKVLYCKIEDGVLSTYADDKFTTQTATGFSCVSAPFNKVEYSYGDDSLTLSILVNAYTNKASLVLKDGTLDIDVSDAAFAYDDATKTLTITVGEDTYTFTYVPEVAATETAAKVPAKFTYQAGDDVKTLTEKVEEEYISEEDADEYEYAYRYQNFRTGSFDLNFNVDTADFNTSLWKKFKFDYYVTEKMCNDRFQFIIYVKTGVDENGGMRYYFKTITCGSTEVSEGWNTFELNVTELSQSRNPDFADFSGEVVISTTGWTNGPQSASDHNQAYDGYTMYIKNIQFTADIGVVVDGPDEPAEGEEPCQHVDENGNNLWVSVADRVKPTCSIGGYALVKCSNCNATKIDTSKAIYNPIGHDYTDAEVLTKAATCTQSGYTYHCCNTCGEAAQLSILEALGHDYVTKYVAQTKSIISTCRVCGEEEQVKLSDSMMTMPEKIAAAGLAEKEYFYVGDGVNNTLSVGSFTTATEQPFMPCVALQCKFSKGTAVQLDDGTYAYKLQRAPGSNGDSYIDYNLDKRYGEGGHFVCEFALRLGGADADGKYEPLSSTLIERVTSPTGGPTSIPLFNINDQGVLNFSTDSTATITFSPDRFTNVALVFKCMQNLVDVYVDGYRMYTIPMASADKTDYVATKPWSQMRITYTGGVTAKDGQFHYYNNFATYAGDYPICILGLNGAGAVDEFTGKDIFLEDETGATATYPINVVADKVLSLPDGIDTSKYVLQFKLSAEAALSNGKLLSGSKEDKYKMFNTLDLLTVKDGWLYFDDTIVASLENISSGIEIKMAFDELNGGAKVYVNGTEVPGGIIAYPAATGNADMYADPESRIRSFTFASEVGAYTVSDLTMYAGE